ncbi:TPA: hypothetical protein ACF9H0_002458 [Staphylococcus aureus]|uniref:hypothetical protein n=1 Tax=Staphylococcus TaxID=1279 RepID=UPI000450DEA9|nr:MULTISPECIES: hypothetical protein [Staphylococcus]MBE5677203.1 hypothetical protein [Staphylococcus singaporensis]NKP41886.1 hypothetical protein [Staphylococcus aureus]EWJ88091.1 hypothetical protein U607_02692 [Staphylococcus aureus F36687]EWT80257.1 hypothetical protein V330_02743 [Staphylococcus aureus F85609]EWV01695.1 hypothetical protein U621_02827 [Staphylococcus aureus F53393]
MSYDDELFGDIDKVAQPQKLDSNNKSNKNKQTLFKHFNQVEDTLNNIQDTLIEMHQLYNELGEGKITNQLTLQRRNEIVESLEDYQSNMKKLTQSLNDYVDNDLSIVKGLRVVRSTSTSEFEKLLNRSSNQKLTSKDLSFQRRH